MSHHWSRNTWPRTLNRAIIFVDRAAVAEDLAIYWIAAYQRRLVSPFANEDLQMRVFKSNAMANAQMAEELWVRATFNMLAWLA